MDDLKIDRCIAVTQAIPCRTYLGTRDLWMPLVEAFIESQRLDRRFAHNEQKIAQCVELDRFHLFDATIARA